MCAINSDSRFVLFINLLNSSALISKYNLNESQHTELTIYCGPAQVRDAIHIQRVTDWVEGKCKVSGLPGGLRFSGDKWGLFSLLLLLFYSFIFIIVVHWIGFESKVYVLFCKSSFQLELEISGKYFAVNFNSEPQSWWVRSLALVVSLYMQQQRQWLNCRRSL